MKRSILAASIVLLLLGTCFSAHAKRDIEAKFFIEDALANPKIQQALRSEVSLYWGNQPVPANSVQMQEIKTSKRSNGIGKEDIEACQWAFASAIRALQDSARRAGGNGLMNIQSNIDNILSSSENQFDCAVGSVMVNVAFKATIIKTD
ncbi:MAG: hypothetical protein ABFS19_13535 [Thermodesulfobacteriota bacterium]